MIAVLFAISIVPAISFAGNGKPMKRTGENSSVQQVPLNGVVCNLQRKKTKQSSRSGRAPVAVVSGTVLRGL